MSQDMSAEPSNVLKYEHWTCQLLKIGTFSISMSQNMNFEPFKPSSINAEPCNVSKYERWAFQRLKIWTLNLSTSQNMNVEPFNGSKYERSRWKVQCSYLNAQPFNERCTFQRLQIWTLNLSTSPNRNIQHFTLSGYDVEPFNASKKWTLDF